MYRKTYLLIILLLSFLSVTKSQVQDSSKITDSEPTWFASINLGLQMSGIKDEDFKGSNYTPLFNITAGKWLLPHLALQIGYKGFYFNTISDDVKHHYHYLYCGGVLNLNNAIDPVRENKSWDLLLHAGAGYFYNNLYGRANLCANLGIQNNFQLADQLQASLDISAIMGWDIYQGDEDILPGITIGLVYSFGSE